MNNYDFVSAYFDGDLSQAEQADLLNRLETDGELKQEFELHTDMIEGIKANRKAELKAMLDNVLIPPAGIAEGLSVGKAAIMGGAIIAAGVAYWATTTNDNTSSQGMQVTPKEVIEPIDQLLPDPIEDIKEEAPVIAKVEKDNTVNKTIDAEEVVNNEVEISKPITTMPTELLADDEEIEAPETGLGYTKPTTTSLEIEIDNSSKKHDFHYQFKEGRLHLFGDFDHELYELLEFNKESGKEYYLYYSDAYYNLDPTNDKITKLNQIEDAALIETLQQARQ